MTLKFVNKYISHTNILPDLKMQPVININNIYSGGWVGRREEKAGKVLNPLIPPWRTNIPSPPKKSGKKDGNSEVIYVYFQVATSPRAFPGTIFI